jgi:hypothetical protein
MSSPRYYRAKNMREPFLFMSTVHGLSVRGVCPAVVVYPGDKVKAAVSLLLEPVTCNEGIKIL